MAEKLYKTRHRPDVALCSSLLILSIDIQMNENETMKVSKGFETVTTIKDKVMKLKLAVTLFALITNITKLNSMY